MRAREVGNSVHAGEGHGRAQGKVHLEALTQSLPLPGGAWYPQQPHLRPPPHPHTSSSCFGLLFRILKPEKGQARRGWRSRHRSTCSCRLGWRGMCRAALWGWCPVGLVLGVFMVSLCTFLHPSNLHVASCPPLWNVKHTDPQHKADCETCASAYKAGEPGRVSV